MLCVSLASQICTQSQRRCSVAPGRRRDEGNWDQGGGERVAAAADPRRPRRGGVDLLPLRTFHRDQQHGGGEQQWGWPRGRPVPGAVHLHARSAAAFQRRHHPRLPQDRGPLGGHVRLRQQRRPRPSPRRRRRRRRCHHGRSWVVRDAPVRAGLHLPQPDEAVRVPDQPLRRGVRRVRPVLRRLRLRPLSLGLRQRHQGRRVGGPDRVAHGTAPVAAHVGPRPLPRRRANGVGLPEEQQREPGLGHRPPRHAGWPEHDRARAGVHAEIHQRLLRAVPDLLPPKV